MDLEENVSKAYCFLSKVARATVSRARERSDPHRLPRLRIKAGRPDDGISVGPSRAPYQHRQKPIRKAVWGKTNSRGRGEVKNKNYVH